MKKSLFIIFVGLFLIACATSGGTIKKMNSVWVGQHLDQFVLKNGAPYTSYTLSTGDIAYRWESGIKNSSDTIMVCEIQIVTDSKGIIKQITLINDTDGEWQLSRCSETLKQPKTY
mgnify:CR=1 FL=1